MPVFISNQVEPNKVAFQLQSYCRISTCPASCVADTEFFWHRVVLFSRLCPVRQRFAVRQLLFWEVEMQNWSR